MSWIIIALIAPFIWSIVNHVDKYLVSKYFKGGIGALMIFVGVIALPLALIIFVFSPDVFTVSIYDVALLLATGLLYNMAVLLYLDALEKEDASLVVPFWQLTPVFTYFFGLFLLSEQIEQHKIIGGVIVLFGALLLSFKKRNGKLKLRKEIFYTMIVSSVYLALGNVLFKKAAVEDFSFWTSIFWNQVGMFLFGLICFASTLYRQQFIKALKENSKTIIGVNILEQIFETIGIIVNNYAILLAPVAIIILIEYSVQPLFVFLLGIIFTLLFPRFIKEDISKKNLALKFVSILIMAVGVYLVTN